MHVIYSRSVVSPVLHSAPFASLLQDLVCKVTMVVGFMRQKRGEGRTGHFLFKYMKIALYRLLEALLDTYWLHLAYFVGVSILGFLLLHLSHTKSQRYLNQLDAFYTSVSAVTASSLGAVRMQEFSEFQLVTITILMLLGGEVFTSMLCLHLRRLSATKKRPNTPERDDLQHREVKMDVGEDKNLNFSDNFCQTRGATADRFISSNMDRETLANGTEFDQIMQTCNDHQKYKQMDQNQEMSNSENIVEDDLEYRALTFLSYITLAYLVVVQLAGIFITILCFSFSPARKHILNSRDVKISTFAVFTIVSSFANCGFIPLDDNMMPFRKDSVLLFTVALQVLLGNTMYAPCLRALIWILRLFSKSGGPNSRLYEYILQDRSNKLYNHLFPTSLSVWLVLTVVGFVTVQLVLTCVLQWRSEALDGLNTWEKLVAAGFQSVVIRHAGENVMNPQLLSSAVIVLYIVMMYLPPYPVYQADQNRDVMKVEKGKNYSCKRVPVCHADEMSIGVQLEKLLLQDSCYLIMAVILICITERDSLSEDPLNYKVLNIVFEIVSAYGNVGISMGYSCSLFRKLIMHSAGHCEDVSYSFSGKWSSTGKVVIIMVMFLGRLKGIKPNRCIFLDPTAKSCRHIQSTPFKLLKKCISPFAPSLFNCHRDEGMNTNTVSHHSRKEVPSGQQIRHDCTCGHRIQEPCTVEL